MVLRRLSFWFRPRTIENDTPSLIRCDRAGVVTVEITLGSHEIIVPEAEFATFRRFMKPAERRDPDPDME